MKTDAKYWGFVPVIGESLGLSCYKHDDLGIRPETAGDLLESCRANAVYIPMVEGKFLKPQKDAAINWEMVDKMALPLIRPGVEPFIYLTYYDFPDWMGRGDAFWKEADTLMESLVRRYVDIGCKYFIFENEPNMYGQEDWAVEYMEHLRHFHKIVRGIGSEALIIAGNLSERAWVPDGAWETLYRLGFKEYSDILGYHPYSDDPETGIDIEDAGKTHVIMEKYGDGDKPMFFGEGWGPKRLILQAPRGEKEPVNDDEILLLHRFLRNGYRRLLTRSEHWNPDWFMGALFFTLNENIGKRGWSDRVRHVDNDGDGIPDTWYIDKVWLGTETPDIAPEFYNGGLVDMKGVPKGKLLDLFPSGVSGSADTI